MILYCKGVDKESGVVTYFRIRAVSLNAGMSKIERNFPNFKEFGASVTNESRLPHYLENWEQTHMFRMR